jgi:hypothetical protein
MARWQPDSARTTAPDAAIARTRQVHETERRRRGIRQNYRENQAGGIRQMT